MFTPVSRTLSRTTSRAAHAVLCAAMLAFAARDARAQTKEIVIPDGTEFTVVTTEEISSKTATEGDPITFKVEDNVKVDGIVVIAQGTTVKGVVSDAKKAGRMGKAGTLNIRIVSTTTVDGQRIKLRASKGKEGENATGSTVALTVLFGPIGLLKSGKDAVVKEGAVLTVYTDESLKVKVKG